MGPGIRLFNYLSFESHVGVVTDPISISQDYFPRFFYGGTSMGQMIKLSSKFRIEIEEGFIWLSSDDEPGHIPYVSIGVGLK